MKIAVTYNSADGEIFQHFGKTQAFKIYDVDNGIVKSFEVTETGDYSHGALVGFLQGLGVQALICGGIGMGAKEKLDAAGIKLYGGAKGSADSAVSAYLSGTLEYDPLAAEHHGACHH